MTEVGKMKQYNLLSDCPLVLKRYVAICEANCLSHLSKCLSVLSPHLEICSYVQTTTLQT